MSIGSTIRMTARQYRQLGEDPPGVRLELVDGQIAVRRSNTVAHQHALMHLMICLGAYVDDHDLGILIYHVDVLFDEYNVLSPDLSYIRHERRSIITEDAIEGAPDRAVEIVNVDTYTIDGVDKREFYARHGVGHYWIVEPDERRMTAYALDGGDYQGIGRGAGTQRVTFPPFPELEIALDDLWLKR